MNIRQSRDFERSDSQPEIPGGRHIPTHGLHRKRLMDRESQRLRDLAPTGPGRRSPAQSPSYSSQALEKLNREGTDRATDDRLRSAQGGMPSQSQLEEKYGRGAYRVEGLMNRDKDPYKHTFAKQYSDIDDFDFWGRRKG